MQFVSVVQGLIRAARQLRQLHLHKNGDSEMELDNEHTQVVRSTLLRRLLAAASSVSVSEPAAQLLSALNTDAAASGNKLDLFHCRDGRFPEVHSHHLYLNSSKSMSWLELCRCGSLRIFPRFIKVHHLLQRIFTSCFL